jgi:glycine dehydrogenase
MLSLDELEGRDEFVARHIGPNTAEQTAMCAAIGVKDRAELIGQTVPAGIRRPADLPLGAPMTEHTALAKLKVRADQNQIRGWLAPVFGRFYRPLIQVDCG